MDQMRMTVNDFLDAARLGQCARIEHGLQHDAALIHARNEQGRTPLHLAAHGGYKEIVDCLLKQGADPNARDQNGQTALIHMAFWCTRRDLAELLLERGADINARDHDGNSALYIAASCIRRPGHAWGDHESLANFLLERGAALDIFTASILNKHQDAEKMLAASPHLVGLRDKNTGSVVDNATPLHRAAEWGYVEMTKVLLSHGADVSAKDARGRAPILLAAHDASPRKAKPSPAVVDLLLTHGVEIDIFASAVLGRIDSLTDLLTADPSLVNARDMGGSSPLHLAAWNDQWAAAEFLIERGADVNVRNRRDETPVALARDDFARQLIERGAVCDIIRALGLGANTVEDSLRRDPSAVVQKNRYGRPALRIASENAMFGHGAMWPIVDLLIAQGAEVDIWTAATLGRTEAVAALLDADPSLLNAYDNTRTPLLRAVAQGHLPVVEFLVERGAALEAVAEDGATPMIMALWSGKSEIAQFLAAHGANVNALDGWGTEPWVAAALGGQA